MRAGGDGELNSEINVTPLVDVMLVLLIIFMITAPLMQNNGVTVELPQVTAEDINEENGPLVLEIKADQIKLGKSVVKWVDLERLLANNDKVKADGKLYIAADKTMLYGRVVTAMSIAKQAKDSEGHFVVKSLMFLTSPNDLLDLKELDKNTGH